MASIDFDQLIREQVQAPVCMDGDLSLWGGSFQVEELDHFLQSWNLEGQEMPWHIWEWVSDLLLEHEEGTLPFELEHIDAGRTYEWLERARLFGPGGDLSLRRNGEQFLWHFVGPATVNPPAGFDTETGNYWAGRPEGWALRAHEGSVLLWGQERQDGDGNPFWQEDRVGGVRRPLVYPAASGRDGRVQLCYREYLRGGDVEAVWWLGLEGLGEACEEGSHE